MNVPGLPPGCLLWNKTCDALHREIVFFLNSPLPTDRSIPVALEHARTKIPSCNLISDRGESLENPDLWEAGEDPGVQLRIFQLL